MLFDELKKKIEEGITEPQLHGVDFKRNWDQKHGQDISAIANHEGIQTGWVVVGVQDSGKVAGFDENWLKNTEQTVSNHIRQYLEPSWAVKRVFGQQINGGCCLFIEISNPQDVVKWNGKAYHLVGTTSSPMKEYEAMALSLRLPGTDFSKAKYEGSYDSALIIEFAQKAVQQSDELDFDIATTPPIDFLKKLNIDKTNAAGILFGEFSFRIVSFDADGDILDQRTKKGLYSILSDSFIEEIQSRSRKKGTSVEGSIAAQEDSPYPLKALREVFANAVAHALYQKNQGDIVVEIHPNRIVARNNCTLEAKAFVDKWFSRIHKPVNKHLMNVLRIPRIADEQGSGKIRVFRMMLEEGKREPIIDFQVLGDYARWSTTLFNEESNQELRKLAEEMKGFFSNDEWRIATALILWRTKTWMEISQYLDEHYKHVAEQVLDRRESPVVRIDDHLYTKRWVQIRLSGQVTKEFTEGEKAVFYQLLNRLSFAFGQQGHISSDEARGIIGLSNAQSEKTQLARLFSEWKSKKLMVKEKKGNWRFLNKVEPSAPSEKPS